MAFNGSGLFQRLYNWVTDRDAAIKIRADRMDAEMDGFATGLSTCVTKDGQTTTTARVPFAQGVGLGDGSVSAPAVNFTADTNTGIYRIGADNLGVAANGAKVVDVSTSGASFTGLVHGTTVRAGQATSLGTNGTVFQASSNTTVLPDTTNTALEEWVAHFGIADGSNGGIGISTFGGFPMYDFRRARGTAAARTALKAGDAIGTIGGLGHDGTSYTGGAAQHRFFAAGNWSPTNQPSGHAFITVPSGGRTFLNERTTVWFDPSGSVGISRTGTFGPSDMSGASDGSTTWTSPTGQLHLDNNASELALTIRSGGATNFTGIGIGRTALEFSIGTAGNTNDFVTGSAAGDSAVKANANLYLAANGSGTAVAIKLATTGVSTFPGTLVPSANDGAALGTTALQYSDLFLAEGGVINWDNGDVTITQTGNVLSFAGAATRYEFDANLTPSTSDGAALGTTALMFSDAFLASGAVLNFNNGNYTVTHSAGLLTFSGNVTISGGLTLTGDLTWTSTAWTSYTPTVTATTGTFTSVSATGFYKQLGKTIIGRAAVTVTTIGTAAGRMKVTLPVASLNTAMAIGSGFNNVTFKQAGVEVFDAQSIGSVQYYDGTFPATSGEVVYIEFKYEAS